MIGRQTRVILPSAIVLAIVACASVPTVSWAQSPPTAPAVPTAPTAATVPGEPTATAGPVAAAATDIGDVVVTARRSSEKLQNVPLSITAFSKEQLSVRGSVSLKDISQQTPGFNYASYANEAYPVLTIRGEAQRAITNFEENVSTFYGGIYLPRAYMVDTGMTGLERIEVVEGPQSALYGRNAFAGAINYVPLAPPNHLTADLFTTLGTNERFDYGATLGAAVVPDKLQAIAGFSHSQFDGTWSNSVPDSSARAGGTTGNMGGWNNNTYFAALTVAPIDRLKVTFGWFESDRDTEDAGRYSIDRNGGSTNCDPVGGINQFYCGQLPLLQPNVDPRSQGLHAKSDIYRLAADYRFSDQLSLHYLFGYITSSAYSFDQTSNNSVHGDIPGANLIEFLGLPIGSVSSVSHELRLVYDNGATKASIGGFYSSTLDKSIVSLLFLPAGGTTPITPATPGQIVISNDNTTIYTRSVFGQVSQDFVGGLFNIEAEGRYTSEQKSDFNLLGPTTSTATFNYFTPRVEAKWNLSPVNNVYISAAEGVKSGGFNGGAVLPNERTYLPESNWTYELGSKNLFFDRRLQLNADVFYVDWSNLQTVSTSANPAFVGTITRNVGTVTDYGLEATAVVKLAPGLTANAGFAFANPTYGNGLVDPRFQLMETATGAHEIICNGITCPADGSIGGNQLAVESKYQATFGLQYEGELPINDAVHYSVGGDVDYRSIQYVDPLLLTWVPATTLVNLNGSLDYKGFELEAYVKNLLDLKYVSGAVYTLAPTTDVRYEVSLGERRTIGFTLRYHY